MDIVDVVHINWKYNEGETITDTHTHNYTRKFNTNSVHSNIKRLTLLVPVSNIMWGTIYTIRMVILHYWTCFICCFDNLMQDFLPCITVGTGWVTVTSKQQKSVEPLPTTTSKIRGTTRLKPTAPYKWIRQDTQIGADLKLHWITVSARDSNDVENRGWKIGSQYRLS
jgi:hypothetical protein